MKKYNLNEVNESKTEEHRVKRKGDENWKKCKYLGTLLDTNCDIAKRKRLAVVSYNKFNHIFKNKNVSIKTKHRIFSAYVESIFLYNSEIWTLTKKLEEEIDVFQRSLLQKLLNIHWPVKISNNKLYEKVKEEPWSAKIRKRRLSWLGHLLRLPSDAPAKEALEECQRAVRRPRGKPKATWMSLVKGELKRLLNLDFDAATEIAKDRNKWRSVVDGAMSETDDTA